MNEALFSFPKLVFAEFDESKNMYNVYFSDLLIRDSSGSYVPAAVTDDLFYFRHYALMHDLVFVLL